MTHMTIWDAVSKTDPKYTKQFNRGGGFKGTATNATYIAMKLTETFGPCGQGWRMVLDDEKYVPGAPLDSVTGVNAMLHVVRGHLDYKVGDVWHSTGPQYGQTFLVTKDSRGIFTDEEAPKKSMTDLFSKCAVMLGFAADIHLGLYDDNKYVESLREEFAEKPEVKVISGPQAGELARVCAETSIKPEDISRVFGIDSILALPEEALQRVTNGCHLVKACADSGRDAGQVALFYKVRSLFDVPVEQCEKVKAAILKPKDQPKEAK